MVTQVQKKTTKKGDSMAVVTLEDMEGEVTLVVFPKLYKKCAATLAGEVDPESGESTGDVFVKVLGKLERGDRGNQVICLEVDPLVLDESANRPKVMEVNIPAGLLTRPYMDSMNDIISRYPGLDHVELRVDAADGSLATSATGWVS